MGKAKRNITKGLYAYLDSINVWNKGSEEITLAKKEYYKQYKSEWRKNQRKVYKQYTIVLNQNEVKYVTDFAKKHRRSVTAFIKASSMAYLRQQFVIPDIVAINSIRELLIMNYTYLQKLFEEGRISYQDGKTLLKQFEEMEQKILQNLYYPESLEKRIIETIRKYPKYKETVLQLLQNA